MDNPRALRRRGSSSGGLPAGLFLVHTRRPGIASSQRSGHLAGDVASEDHEEAAGNCSRFEVSEASASPFKILNAGPSATTKRFGEEPQRASIENSVLSFIIASPLSHAFPVVARFFFTFL